jgi:hypothetical protein
MYRRSNVIQGAEEFMWSTSSQRDKSVISHATLMVPTVLSHFRQHSHGSCGDRSGEVCATSQVRPTLFELHKDV